MKIIHFLYNKLITMIIPEGSEYASPQVYSETRTYQGSEYAPGSEYTRVLNMLEVRRVLICLNMPK